MVVIFFLLIEGLLAIIGCPCLLQCATASAGWFVMVLLLMVFVITNDLLKTFGGARSNQSSQPQVRRQNSPRL
jgi:hypothetical protein